MTYKEFKAMIDLQILHHNKIHQAYKLKIDLIDAFDNQEKLVDLLWEQILSEKGVNWLRWYLYEKDGISGKPKSNMTANDENGKEICKNVKGLYDFLRIDYYII